MSCSEANAKAQASLDTAAITMLGSPLSSSDANCRAMPFSDTTCITWLEEIITHVIHKQLIGAKKSTQTFFVQSFSTTLRVMDVRAENRGRAHQKVRFPAAPVVGRNFLTPGHPGVRVRNVRGKSGSKSLCLCCFFFSELRV